ncbi:MAG: hypothetical protein KA260_09285 [Burkholderiales bacterium]|nr:hypothetical protein [Burkholderiales bacterium]
MITNNISTILLVTGLVTMLPLLQFLFPAAILKLLNKIEIRDEAGLFFARHWGMMAFVVGGLLVYASGHPEARLPVISAALIEKAALVLLIALNWNKPFGKGFAVTLLFDGACCVIYGLYLVGLA